jgi:uncharacterized YigZ family protein
MKDLAYKSLAREASAEIVEKKSRFIAYAGKIGTEDEAVDFIEKTKNIQKAASHYVYAYITGREVPTERFTDDGEPHGTAGMPVLEAIRSNGLTDSIIVVVRYFGGTLLGTGGLARTYSDSAAKVLQKAGVAQYIPARKTSVETDYHFLGRIKHHVETAEYPQVDEKYTDNVIIELLVPVGDTQEFTERINALTNAQATISYGDVEYIKKEI